MNRIKEARRALGLSQKYVAVTLGVAGPSVSNWENGKTNPTPENYASLAQLFGVSVDYLMGRDEHSKQQETANTGFQKERSSDRAEGHALLDSLSRSELEEAIAFMRFQQSRRKD